MESNEVANAVRWRQINNEIYLIDERFNAHLTELIRAPAFRESVGHSLLDGLSILPERTRHWLIRSPSFVSQALGWARGDSEPDVRTLSQYVLAELVKANITEVSDIQIWTARGTSTLRSINGQPMSQITSLGKIAIDHRSPQQYPYDGVSEKLLLPMPESDAKQVFMKLEKCMTLLAANSPQAHQFVNHFLEQISLRIEPELPDRFNSSSFSKFIGLALLVNPNVERADLCNLTEALVHEAMHSMLFMLEEVEGPFLIDRNSARVVVTSPWSGAEINLHAYIHACVVWFGLYWLWEVLIDTGAYPEKARALQNRAHSGFLHRPLANISAYHALIEESALEMLHSIERSMALVDDGDQV